jgi:hypothetical protein
MSVEIWGFSEKFNELHFWPSSARTPEQDDPNGLVDERQKLANL